MSGGLSVVIPTYRRPRSLQRVLEGLKLQDYPRHDLEIIIVDDGGDDGTADIIESVRVPFVVRLLKQQNLGPGAARNLGVQHATRQLVLFLDDDVVPTPTLVAQHTAAHGGRDDLVVIGTMLGDARERRPWLRWESFALAKQYEAMERGVFKPTPWQFYTGNASVQRAHLIRAGGFDERYRRAEDIELGFRLEQLGLEFVFCREAAAVHLMRRSWASWLDVARQYGRNDVAFGKVNERVVKETSKRHPHTRRLIGWGIAHPRLRSAVPVLAAAAAIATHGLGASRVAMAICGAVFNLEYWIGVEEAVGRGDCARLLDVVRARANSAQATRQSEEIFSTPDRSAVG